MTIDPADQPADSGYTLAVPFVLVTSRGGPYDDQAFTAGFAAGSIDRALTGAAVLEAHQVTFTTYTALVPQLELIAMHRGYPLVDAQVITDVPDWSVVTFTRGEPL